MKLKLLIIVAIMVLQGCDKNEADAIKMAQEAVAKDTLDPPSVQFRNVRAYRRQDSNEDTSVVVCGEFNAKNVFGGYTGFHPFHGQKLGGHPIFVTTLQPNKNDWAANTPGAMDLNQKLDAAEVRTHRAFCEQPEAG